MATDYGVSLNIVREGLSRLASERLVKTQPQQGFAVTAMTASELNDLTFVRNLLSAYSRRGTADPVAREALLRANWSYADDLRDQFFELLSRTGKLRTELRLSRIRALSAPEFAARNDERLQSRLMQQIAKVPSHGRALKK